MKTKTEQDLEKEISHNYHSEIGKNITIGERYWRTLELKAKLEGYQLAKKEIKDKLIKEFRDIIYDKRMEDLDYFLKHFVMEIKSLLEGL